MRQVANVIFDSVMVPMRVKQAKQTIKQVYCIFLLPYHSLGSQAPFIQVSFLRHYTVLPPLLLRYEYRVPVYFLGYKLIPSLL